MRQKVGGGGCYAPFREGELGPQVTRVSPGPRSYLCTKCSPDPSSCLSTTDMAVVYTDAGFACVHKPRECGTAVPLSVGGGAAGYPSNSMWPGK